MVQFEKVYSTTYPYVILKCGHALNVNKTLGKICSYRGVHQPLAMCHREQSR